MKDASPPRFVPILTEVVKTEGHPADAPPPVSAPADPSSAAPPPVAGGGSLSRPSAEAAPSEDELARRVLERVLVELEPVVLDALRTVQAQQARSLEVMVRAELATRVARLVSESLATRPRS